MPIAAAVGAYGGAEVATDDCDDSDVRDGDGDPAAFLFRVDAERVFFFPTSRTSARGITLVVFGPGQRRDVHHGVRVSQRRRL
jgi:hypothetical protein